MSANPADDSVERMEFLLNLRRSGIMDADVLRAMDEVPREYFVPPEHAAAAYADHALPIPCGQTISQPYVVAFMTEQLAPEPEHRVLEIGTGSGYQAAVLSRLAREVVTVERYRTLAQAARTRFQTLGYGNIEVLVADGMLGAPEKAPYERIMVTAAAAEVPQALVDQLADEGVLLLPLGADGGPQHIVKVTRRGEEVAREELLPVRFVPLVPGKAREL